MKLGELAGPECRLPAEAADVEITGLSADSREIRPGYLFAALPGTAMNGADFIPQAIERGAVAVLMPEEGDASACPVPVVRAGDPRRALALMAARFYPRQPTVIAAVTGTNGKTSVVSFLRQIWRGLGHSAASLGTIGVDTPSGAIKLAHTTPDPVGLHAVIDRIAAEGVTHLAFEASSHGLQQRRLDGVRLAAAAFTNISRDHLDYHATFEDYLQQKLRLFDTLLPEGAPVVVDSDEAGSDAVTRTAQARHQRVISVGAQGETLKLSGVEREGFSQRLAIETGEGRFDVLLPLAGRFQVANALVAAGLAVACGEDAARVLPLLAQLKGARGRLELVGHNAHGAPVFVDYAHTPDALRTALETLRPYASGRLAVVFGCGGDRDRGKRPEMGSVAASLADLVIVTDDNPRSESPDAIRREILAGAPDAREIGDRREAIAAAIAALGSGDLLLVAGKGHETGQSVADRVLPFSDHDVIAQILEEGRRK
ncbi:MAG: UDP-N-acetylmuramoyl-L-alanyl-D-glutamate--2,6-diaminopimelate ligase [Methyloligellaceae bacterium]